MHDLDTGVRPATAAVVEALNRGRFRYRNELQLHDGMVIALNTAGITVGARNREVHLPGAGRIEFLLGGLGVEVKVDGPARAVWRQLHRYAASPHVEELLLVTTRARHAVAAPIELDGKPVSVLVLRGGLR